ncbi:MAG: hypothetical protein EOO13_11715 [Chitinophagaceae bacterium]|nr:MAG: hypothetical protein EOO13_11715 [Chitinophagaceae bacterium]
MMCQISLAHIFIVNYMQTETWIGLSASIFTGISMLPQLIKIYKEKKEGDISYVMLCILITGLGLWVWYGVVKEDWIIIISNGISILINLTILFLNIYYKNNDR